MSFFLGLKLTRCVKLKSLPLVKRVNEVVGVLTVKLKSQLLVKKVNEVAVSY